MSLPRCISASSLRLLLCLSLAFLSLRAPAKDLKDCLSYDEFQELVKTKAGEIPELQGFWNWGRVNSQPLYMGGGALRGLIHWIYRELQTNSLEEVKLTPVPGIAKLLLQARSDADLYVPNDTTKAWLRRTPAYKDRFWDLIGEDFHRESVRVGGMALEKTRVSPNAIDDPLGGLRDYYEGKLTFHWTSDDALRNSPLLTHNSRTVQALRLLRIPYELPEVKIPDATMKELGNISVLEIFKYTRTDRGDYWVNKALKRLYIATGHNLYHMLADLARANLLEFLANKGYTLTELVPSHTRLSASHLAAYHISLTQVPYLEAVMGMGWEEAILLKADALKEAKTPAEFLAILRSPKAPPADEYKKAVESLVMHSLDQFFDLKPTLAQVKELGSEARLSAKDSSLLLGRAAKLTKSPEEYIGFVRLPTPAYRAEYSALIRKTLPHFLSLEPTINDLKKLRAESHATSELGAELLDAAVKRAGSWEELIDVVKPLQGLGDQSQEISRAVQLNLEKFVREAGSIEALSELRREASLTKEAHAAVLKAGLPLVKTAGDYLSLMRFARSHRSAEETRALDEVGAESLSRFLELGPSGKEKASLAVLLGPSSKTGAALFRDELKKAATLDEILELTKLPDADKEGRERLLREAMARLTELKPSARDWLKFLHERCNSIEIRLDVLERALPAAASLEEYLALLEEASPGHPAARKPGITNVVRKSLSQFLAGKPGKEELARLSKLTGGDPDITVQLELYGRETALPAVLTAPDYLRLAYGEGVRTTPGKQACDSFVSKSSARFFALNPTPEQEIDLFVNVVTTALLRGALVKERLPTLIARKPTLAAMSGLLQRLIDDPATFHAVLEEAVKLVSGPRDFKELATVFGAGSTIQAQVTDVLEKHFDRILGDSGDPQAVRELIENLVTEERLKTALTGKALAKARTPGEFLDLAASRATDPSLKPLVLSALDTFFAGGPTPEQINWLIDVFGRDPVSHEAIVLKALPRLQGTDALKKIKLPGLFSRSARLRAALNYFKDLHATTPWQKFCRGAYRFLSGRGRDQG